MKSFICLCKQLVNVVDGKIVDHGDCPASGMRYTPQRIHGSRPSEPKIDLIGTGKMKWECDQGHQHEGVGQLIRITEPNPNLN